MNYAPELRTHAQKVCSLYKRAMRCIEGHYVINFCSWVTLNANEKSHKLYLSKASMANSATRDAAVAAKRMYVTRYHQCLLRYEFDKNKCIKDPKEQRRLLWVGEYEAFMKQPALMPAKFPKTYGLCTGIAAERVVEPPDWVLDYWHPLEKAHFPCYFQRREQRKCEYIQLWHKGVLR